MVDEKDCAYAVYTDADDDLNRRLKTYKLWYKNWLIEETEKQKKVIQYWVNEWPSDKR